MASSRSASSGDHVVGPGVRDRLDLVVGDPDLPAEAHVLDPLVLGARTPRDPEDHELASSGSSAASFKQHAVVREPRTGERGVVHQRPRARWGPRGASGAPERKRFAAPPTCVSSASRASSLHSLDGNGGEAFGRAHTTVPPLTPNDLPGDVARFLGAQERAGGGDVVARARRGPPGCDRPGTRSPAGRRRPATSRDIGVSIIDGGIVFTVIPAGPNSTRQRPRQRDDAALRRDVVRHARRALLRARRRDRHDAAPAGGDHVGDRGLKAVERAGEVDRERAVPRLEADVGERFERCDPGARHHDLDRPELAADRVERRVDRRRGRTRRPRTRWPPRRRPAGRRRLLGGVAVEVEHRDPVAARARGAARSRAPSRTRLR